MDAAILQAASVVWAALSAVAVILLGVVALAGGRSRPPGSMAFGAFAVLWGLQVLTGRFMAFVEVESATRAHLLFVALLLPLPYFLVQFARAFAREATQRWAWRGIVAASVAVPFAAVAALIVVPESVYAGATLFEGRSFPRWGPLYPLLVVFPFYGALALALVSLDAARRASPTGRTASRHALLAAGIGTFTAFSAGNNLSFYAMDLFAGGVHALSVAYAILFAALSVIVLVLGARAWHDALRQPAAGERRAVSVLAAATLLPFAWGAIEGVVAYWWLFRLNTVGLWRLVGIALLAYALARWRLPGLAPRSRKTAATALGVAAAASTGGLFVGALLLTTPAASLLALAAVGAPLASLSPSIRLAHRVLRVRGEAEPTEESLASRIETYRAALEASLARDSMEADAAFLAGLRERLGIGQEAHATLLCLARSTVLAPADASFPGYERLRLLGEGAHGRAWLARQRRDDELVVLKEPRQQDAASRAELARQARLTQRLHHPNLVGTRALIESASGTFLVLDYMPGGSLAERALPLPPERAARLVCEVLAGLSALHEAGLAHGDVKAANVLLDAEGRARLADFGLSRLADADVTMTSGSAQGTLGVMAPEQLDGGAPTVAADVYAAGALLFRLLTGEHYLDFTRVDEVRARAMIRELPPRLPHARVPVPLEPILRRALEKDPAARFASAAELRRELLGAALRL